MHCDAADEVLGAVDLAEIAFPPAVGPLAIDVVEAARGERDAPLDFTRGVLIWLLVGLAVAGRGVEDVFGATLDNEEEQLFGLVDFDERAGVGSGHGPQINIRDRRGGLFVELAVWAVEAHVLLEGHDCLAGRAAVVAVDALDPETKLGESVL